MTQKSDLVPTCRHQRNHSAVTDNGSRTHAQHAAQPGDRYRIFAITCPYHGNSQWRQLRDGSPEEWHDVVEFDSAIRSGNARATAEGTPLLGQAYLHRSRRPLDEAPIDRVTAHEWSGRQGDIFDAIADAALENGDAAGCSPWSCRSGAPVTAGFDLTA